MCNPLTLIVMESNCMKRSLSSNISYVSNLYMLKFFKTCKSKSYLKALFVSRRRLDYLKFFLYKGIHVRKIKTRIKSRGYQIKEKTIPNDLTNKHEVEPAKVELQDESWVEVMHDELHQFQRNDV